MATITREIRKRSFIGKLIKLVFILFNGVMLIWLVQYWAAVGDMMVETASEAGRTGGAIGASLGTGFIVSLWAPQGVYHGARSETVRT
jgi:hypothetical protein